MKLLPGVADASKSLDCQHLEDVPENLEDGCFAIQELERTGFADQPGDYVAVFEKSVVGNDNDESKLRQEAATRLGVPPDRLFVIYKGP